MIDLPSTKLTPRKPNSNTPIVYVSLYFLLLAFFIYLHSISEPVEEKVQQVIGSIDFAFKGIKQKNSKSASSKLTGDEFGLAIFHAEIKRVFETAIPLVESKVNKEGDQLQFVVPVAQLFELNGTHPRQTRADLFEEAARLLIKRSGVTPTDMEIIIDVGDELPTGETIGTSLAVRRVNALVNSFLRSGVPARSVFVGMMSEGSKNIYFKFYIRSSFENQFRKLEGR